MNMLPTDQMWEHHKNGLDWNIFMAAVWTMIKHLIVLLITTNIYISSYSDYKGIYLTMKMQYPVIISLLLKIQFPQTTN